MRASRRPARAPLARLMVCALGLGALASCSRAGPEQPTLRVLGRRRVVLLPRGVQGRVVEQLVEGRCVPVEHNQPLVRLRAGLEASDDERLPAGPAAVPGEPGVDRDLIAVPSPSMAR